MEQLFYLLIPLGLCLFYLGIKYTIRFGRAKMLYEMPYVNKEGTFTLERAGTYGVWLSGKMFTKAPIGEFDLHPFSWTDIIKLFFGNEFGILPDSFLLV